MIVLSEKVCLQFDLHLSTRATRGERALPIPVIVFHPNHAHGTLDISKFDASSPQIYIF